MRLSATSAEIPVCSANVTCAAFQVEGGKLAAKYLAEAEALLVPFAEGRCRLAERCLDPLTSGLRNATQVPAAGGSAAPLMFGDPPTRARLHLRHHATAASAVAINIVGRVSPTPLFDVATLLNAAVHAVQYSYYFAPHTLMPMKRFITSAQIVQHTIVVGAILYALGSAHLTARPCDAPIGAYTGLASCS